MDARIASLALTLVVSLHARTVDFQRDVRPILSDKCFTCHGPDEKTRMMDIRLDTKEGAFAKRGNQQIVSPGDLAGSRLYQRISAANKATRMPPPYAGDGLTDPQIETIRLWIEQGARWDTHWAYAPPVRPEPPTLSNEKWPRNPVDRFILARLEKENLKPSREADKITLLRRVAFDLTGLPPTPAEIDSFLADKRPDAYERRVDELLASPRFGERMAMQWLDLARYADTHGFHIDSHRDMWPWRGWVIRAFNANMPYDQFTIEQLAGDLLPGASRDQKVATGFNRNHMINFEGGAIPEEYLAEYVADRVDTTATVWMGTTMGCARCHDHKYDPIKQKEFYQFAAFFNTVAEKGLDGRAGNAKPYLALPTDPQERQLAAIESEIEKREKLLDAPELEKFQQEWEKTRSEFMRPPGRGGLVVHYEFDGSLSDTSGGYRRGRIRSGDVSYPEGAVGKSGEFGGESHVELAGASGFEDGKPSALAMWVRYSGGKEMSVLQKMEPVTRRGFEFAFEDSERVPEMKRGARLYLRLVHEWPHNALQLRTRDRLIQNQWYHVAVNYDGARPQLFIDGKPCAIDVLQEELSGSIRNDRPLEVGNQTFGPRYRGRLDDLRIYSRILEQTELERLAVDEPVRSLLWDLSAKRSKEQTARLRSYFLTYDAPWEHRKLYRELKAHKSEKERLEKIIPTTMVMAEMKKPRETFVLERGDYRNTGEKVTPGVPSMLSPLPKDAPANRLTLAKWLVDPGHPLTARVAVNQFWQMYFGHGIVKTVEDFGSQGEAPVHPELLDWLATEFVRSGWDVKAMQRLIVTSSTYRQSSKVTAALLEKDPENRLLARGPRFRLPAEMVRDNALAISGLLHGDIGGPSVTPYSPKGLWEDIAYGDIFSAQTYEQGSGKDLYRRSMYTFWKRTAPPATLATFDAPDREKCAARRPLTNTPLQALALMNDPTFVEAARALAQNMLLDGGRDAGRRIVYGFRQATGRRPVSRELSVLRRLAKAENAEYARNPKSAQALLLVGESSFDVRLDPKELAAWTTVASAILSLDEVITKE